MLFKKDNPPGGSVAQSLDVYSSNDRRRNCETVIVLVAIVAGKTPLGKLSDK